MRGAWLVAILLAAVFSGCSEPAAKADEKADIQQSLDDYDVAVTKTTGALRGVVVDSGIRPIANATVNVPGLGTKATTGSDGLFGFEDVEPGVYFLNITAPGYLPVQQSADVAAGEIVDVRVLLAFDPRPQPYHRTISFEWFDQAGVVLVDFAVDLVDRTFLNDTLPDACDNCYFHFAVDGDYSQMIVEAVWEDTVAPPAQESSYYWLVDALDIDEYEDDYFTSPGRVVIEGERFAGNLNFGVGLLADENWITFQQEAEIFVTVFYNQPAPEGWSFIAGDT